jgi:pyrroline-5-carboxylate reductase
MTAAAITAFERRDIAKTVALAVDAAAERAKELT